VPIWMGMGNEMTQPGAKRGCRLFSRFYPSVGRLMIVIWSGEVDVALGRHLAPKLTLSTGCAEVRFSPQSGLDGCEVITTNDR
jgi:hypothetical protein